MANRNGMIFVSHSAAVIKVKFLPVYKLIVI